MAEKNPALCLYIVLPIRNGSFHYLRSFISTLFFVTILNRLLYYDINEFHDIHIIINSIR
jgi:hypothetical protein